MLEFGTPRENEERRDGGCGVVFCPEKNKFAVGKIRDSGLYILFSGGVDSKEDIQEGVLREVKEESGLCNFKHVEKISEALCHYYNELKNVARLAHATCFLCVLENDERVPVQLEEHEKFDLCWVTKDEILENWNKRNEDRGLDHWFHFLEKACEKIDVLDLNS